MKLEVVLTQDDLKLGKRGEVVKVSPGYAHNFLLPNLKAKLATPSNLKSFKEENERQSKEALNRRATAEALAKKIDTASVTIEVLVGDGEKLTLLHPRGENLIHFLIVRLFHPNIVFRRSLLE